MSPAFTKLQRSIIQSSIWKEPDATRLVWITLLALCDHDGIVRISPGMVAHTARVSEEGAAAALAALEQPDPESRTPHQQGRRIRRVDGGFEVFNYHRYLHDSVHQDRRDYFRQKKRESRARLLAQSKERGAI